MTQSPHTGQSAPTNGGPQWSSGPTGPSTAWSGARTDAQPSQGSPWSAPSGGTQHGNGANAPTFTSTPVTQAPPDAPTANVPLVQGTKAPKQAGGGAARDAARAGNARHADGAESGRRGRSRGPRRARLQLRHIDPWTVLKFACVLSIALFFVWLIVVGVLYGVLDGAGVVDKINEAVTSINANGGQPPIRAGIVFGGAAIIGVVNMVLFIALTTIGSVVYNLCADLVGGIEVTLSER